MRVRLIANPAAGSHAPAKIRRAVARLREGGAAVDLLLTARRGDARKAAAEVREGGFDRVIAAGGDGTLNEVVNGLAPSSVPLGFLPLGTANVLALETGIPRGIEAACDLALGGLPRPVCLGMAGGTRFVLMAGIGFDAQVVYGVNLRLKRWAGKLAYVAGGLTALLRQQHQPIVVESEDGKTFRGFGAVIGNARSYGGGFTLTPEASLDCNRLDLCLLLRPGRMNLLRTAAAVAARRPLRPPAALYLQGRRFTVHGEGVPVQIDGDYLGWLPMTFAAAFGEINLILPAGVAPPIAKPHAP